MAYVYKGNPNNMKQQKTPKPSKRVYKRKYKCKDGPLAGNSLWLSDGVTAVMNFMGVKGFYSNGEFTKC